MKIIQYGFFLIGFFSIQAGYTFAASLEGEFAFPAEDVVNNFSESPKEDAIGFLYDLASGKCVHELSYETHENIRKVLDSVKDNQEQKKYEFLLSILSIASFEVFASLESFFKKCGDRMCSINKSEISIEQSDIHIFFGKIDLSWVDSRSAQKTFSSFMAAVILKSLETNEFLDKAINIFLFSLCSNDLPIIKG